MLQRTRPSRSGWNRALSRAGSLVVRRNHHETAIEKNASLACADAAAMEMAAVGSVTQWARLLDLQTALRAPLHCRSRHHRRIGIVFDSRHRRRLLASRQDESICDFARSFDRGKSDTWILRAVYDELSRFISIDARPIAVRPADRCEEDLKIDPEDLDDLAADIAFRARRSMDGGEQNPLYGKVKTVADIVTFFGMQRNATPSSILPSCVEEVESDWLAFNRRHCCRVPDLDPAMIQRGPNSRSSWIPDSLRRDYSSFFVRAGGSTGRSSDLRVRSCRYAVELRFAGRSEHKLY